MKCLRLSVLYTTACGILRTTKRPSMQSHSASMATLLVEPQTALMDTLVSTKLTGLNSEENITLHGHIDEDGKRYGSYAHYTADRNGMVDASKMSSSGGTYEGVEPMGLFWSMKQAPNQRKGLRLVKKDVSTPLNVKLNAYQGHHTWEGIYNKKDLNVLATCNVERWFIDSKNVQKIKVQDGSIRGTLFLPKGNGPFGGVIDIFGSSGGLMEHRAAMLASHGLATLALAYFNYEDLPPSYLNLDMVYFEEATNWMLQHPSIGGTSIGVIGTSSGGDIALQMALLFKEKITAVIAVNPTYFHYSVPAKYKDKDFPAVEVFFNHGIYTEDEGIINYGTQCWPIYEPIPEKVHVKVEEITSNLLMFHSGDDHWVDPCCGFVLKERLKKRVCIAEHDNVLYPGAGHLLEPPYTPLFRVTYNPAIENLCCWGGVAHLHNRAQEDAWKKTLAFFHRHLSKPNQKSKL